ncbi:hypothetical protein HZH68_003538 [Vespula germanica]|uniref:Uncharacterized protein n=1 Tax=Vespula germanica TaxID=30212 RepID=A0A834U3B5_VESGE|nr:hypothetical protein HZH68_003538 [Vespula germanica]
MSTRGLPYRSVTVKRCATDTRLVLAKEKVYTGTFSSRTGLMEEEEKDVKSEVVESEEVTENGSTNGGEIEANGGKNDGGDNDTFEDDSTFALKGMEYTQTGRKTSIFKYYAFKEKVAVTNLTKYRLGQKLQSNFNN